MRAIVKRRWVVVGEAYVEVRYRPATDFLDVWLFTLDKRKKQFHKPKFRHHASSHGGAANVLDYLEYTHGGYWAKVAKQLVNDKIRLTSSVSRAPRAAVG